MAKKLITAALLFVTILTLSACKANEFTVTFETNGGTDVAAVTVEDGGKVALPDAPTKTVDGDVYSFVGWYTDAALENTYDFDTVLTGDVTLYAKWVLEVVLSFDTRGNGTVDAQLLGETGGYATLPTAPTKDDYRFAGWFTTKRGLTWLEEEAFDFENTEITENMTLYAYWEPVNSKTVDYDDNVTYTSTIDSSSSLILNPLEYQWNHEDGFIDMMVTDLYTTEVDWNKAMKDGIASAPGDFSKIEAKEFSIEALDFVYILEGATNYPIDSDGDEHLDENGNYDRDSASTFKDTEWTFKLRDDIYYEDGTNVTAADYEYTLKMFLDPLLNNYRANLFFKTEENKNGAPIVGAYEYYTGEGDWASVGFEVINDYEFKMTFFEAKSQSDAVGYANNLRLVKQDAFEASLTDDKTDAAYGTPSYPYVSYGSYILKSWDENAKLVFNKNYEYILKGTVNYKSRVVQVVDNTDQRMELFAAGTISVAGLSREYYAQYAEADNVFKSWDGYPQYLIVNLANSKVTEGGHEQNDILFDVKFRQALLYGFDRKYYATSVYAPNTASLLPVPLDTKSYNQDALYYSESPAHLQVLADNNINPDTEGYIPERAQTLFNEAYDAWVAAGNTGPVVIKFASDNDEFSIDLATYVEESYEALFNTAGQTDKLDIVIESEDPTAYKQTVANWDFDLSLNAVGFGSSTGIWWQYQAIAFFGDVIGGGALGLSQPHDASTETGEGAYATTMIEIDLSATWAYLQEKGLDYLESEELEGHIEFYNALAPVEDDPATADVDESKPAGIYRGPVEDIALWCVFYDTPFDGSAKEPFPGATQDTWAMIAAFEQVFYDNVTLIPTVTRSSATIYAPNVVIEWPAYSSAFGWGAQRYRYLNTDPDFQ